MSNTLVISMFVFLPIILFVVVIMAQSKKKAKKKRNELVAVYRDIVANDHLQITEEEILHDKIFAIDARKKVFIYIRNHDKPIYDIIHLDGLLRCEVEKKGTSLVTRYKGKSAVALHVNEAYLTFSSKNMVAINLQVYSEINDGQREYCSLMKIAEAWQEKLNSIMKQEKLVSK